MKGFYSTLHGGQQIKGFACQDILFGEIGREEIPGLGPAQAVARPAYPGPVVPQVQKDLDIRAAHDSRFFESALAPVLEPNQCGLDMLACAQAVDAVIRAVAAVDGFCKRANLHPIGLPSFGVDPIEAKKVIARSQRFKLEHPSRGAQAAAYTSQLEARFDELAENPRLGRARSEVAQGYRSLPCGKHIIFYIISNETVEIIGIPHARMDVDHRLSDKPE